MAKEAMRDKISKLLKDYGPEALEEFKRALDAQKDEPKDVKAEEVKDELEGVKEESKDELEDIKEEGIEKHDEDLEEGKDKEDDDLDALLEEDDVAADDAEDVAGVEGKEEEKKDIKEDMDMRDVIVKVIEEVFTKHFEDHLKSELGKNVIDGYIKDYVAANKRVKSEKVEPKDRFVETEKKEEKSGRRTGAPFYIK